MTEPAAPPAPPLAPAPAVPRGVVPGARSGLAGLRRSAALLAAFRTEQTDPARFYRLLAADTVALASRHVDLDGAVVLDVGAGPGFFAEAVVAAGGRYVGLEADAGEATSLAVPDPRGTLGRLLGDGERLPLADGTVDVVLCSNVLEHVPRPWAVADEALRVLRPGGVAFLGYPTWWSPWGGHETSPWHWLGGGWAADRWARRHGRRPKNDFGRTAFAVHARDGLAWARTAPGATLLAAYPRYLPRSGEVLLRLPAVREVLTWNLVLVLRRDGGQGRDRSAGPAGVVRDTAGIRSRVPQATGDGG